MLSAWASQYPIIPWVLCAEYVEGVRMGQCPVARAFHRQHADLGAVAVGDEELVMAQNRGKCRDSAGDVCFLNTGIG